MKYIKTTILILTIILLSIDTAAFDNYLYSIGWGTGFASVNPQRNKWGFDDTYSEYKWDQEHGSFIYFMPPYAGETTWEFIADSKTINNNESTLTCDYLNLTDNTQTWVRFMDCVLGTEDNISVDHHCINITNSDTGIVRCMINCSLSANLVSANISYFSEITYTTPQYRQYTAGVESRLYSVNHWNNITMGEGTHGKTTATPQDGYGIEMTSTNISYTDYNSNGFNLNSFTPDCSLFKSIGSGGTYLYRFINYNVSNPSQKQTYYHYLNITLPNALEITGMTYNNGSTQYFANDVTLNLSVVTNETSLVDAVVWYVDGGTYEVHDPPVYTQTITLTKQTEPYYIEVQLEDINCDQYPTLGFYVYVGKYIEITGQIKGTDGVITEPLSLAYISINNSGGIVANTATNTSGHYNISGLEASKYTITVSKDWYQTAQRTKTYSTGSSYMTSYKDDFTLNSTWDDFIPFVTLNCSANSSILDITCCATTNLDYYWVSSYGNYTSASFLRNTSGCFGFKAQGYTPACGTPYDIWIDGYTVETYQTVYTKACAATTTTTATTSTTIPIVTMSCSANETTDDINCCINKNIDEVFIGYNINNTLESGGAYFNLSASQFCISLVNNLSATGYCGSTYRVIVLGYDNTRNTLDSRNCGGGLPTTTTSTTTTTLKYIPPSCDLNTFDTKKDCLIDFSEINHALQDYLDGKTTLACYTAALTYYNEQLTILNCYITQIPSSNYTEPNYTKPGFICTNLTGKIQTGDIFHAAACSFIIPLSPEWFFGLVLLVIVLLVYMATKTYMAASIIAMIYTSIYYMYIPQPSISILSVGVGLGLGLFLLAMFTKSGAEEWTREQLRRE